MEKHAQQTIAPTEDMWRAACEELSRHIIRLKRQNGRQAETISVLQWELELRRSAKRERGNDV